MLRAQAVAVSDKLALMPHKMHRPGRNEEKSSIHRTLQDMIIVQQYSTCMNVPLGSLLPRPRRGGGFRRFASWFNKQKLCCTTDTVLFCILLYCTIDTVIIEKYCAV